MAEADKEPRWYVAHTYSGYENKVKINIEKTIAVSYTHLTLPTKA